jgi:hypothetical protein
MLRQIKVGPELVSGNSSMNIEVFSEEGPFRALNMVVPDHVAPNFFVTDLKVGYNSCFISNGAVPASYFAKRGETEDLFFDKLPLGRRMTVSVTNARSEAVEFSAILRGLLESGETPTGRPRQDRTILGLGHTLVEAKGTATISAQLQLIFKPDCLVVPPVVLDGVEIVGLRTARANILLEEQQLRSGEIDFSSSLMQPGDWLYVDVVNKMDNLRAFYGVVTGKMVREQ